MPFYFDTAVPRARIRRFAGALVGAFALFVAQGGPAVSEELVSVHLDGATPIIDFDSFVGASAILTQTITGNKIEEINVVRTNHILNSFNGNRGILQANIDNGNIDNQANILVIAFSKSPGTVLVDLSAVIATKNTDNTNSVVGGSRENRVENSFNNHVGVLEMNVNVGNLNNQRNVVVIGNSVSIGPDFYAVADTYLDTMIARNGDEAEPTTSRANIIKNSFKGFKGIAVVTMTAGDHNVTSNMVGVSVKTVNIP